MEQLALIKHQVLLVLVANLGSFSSSLALGYSAVLLPQIRPDDPDLAQLTNVSQVGQEGFIVTSQSRYRPFTGTTEEGSWIAGIFGIGAIFGGIVSGYLGCKYGRKMSLMLLAVPDLLGWILVASSQNLGMMLAGRFLAGFAAAGYSPNIQIYVAEITQPQHRGWLAGLTIPIMAIGVLTSYALGSVLPWHFAAASCTPAPLLLAICLSFFWDSPYWYFSSGDEKKALLAIKQFRGGDANIYEELLQIKQQAKKNLQVHDISYLEGIRRIFTDRKYFKPFMNLNILFLLMLFSGKFAIEFYAVSIFQEAGSDIDEYLSAVIIGFIHLLGSFLFLPLVKRYSRKSLLVISSAVMGLSLILLGLYLYSQSHPLLDTLRSMEWCPLLCIVLYMLTAPIGLCSIPFMYVAEFFPSEMRSIMGGLTISISNLELFIVVKAFPNLEDSMGDYGVYWLYSVSCFCAIFYVLAFIPETKDKDLTKDEG